MTEQNSQVVWIESVANQFRVAAIAEAWSWVGLLLGMFFKYGATANPVGVHVMGPIHGVLFLAYLICAVRIAKRNRWSAGVTTVAIASAVPPLATWIFERWALKRGLLRDAGPA